MGLEPHRNKFGRRDFLQCSLATATLAGLAAPFAALEEVPLPALGPTARIKKVLKYARPPKILGLRDKYFMPYAVFRELQLGSVHPEGWL